MSNDYAQFHATLSKVNFNGKKTVVTLELEDDEPDVPYEVGEEDLNDDDPDMIDKDMDLADEEEEKAS